MLVSNILGLTCMTRHEWWFMVRLVFCGLARRRLVDWRSVWTIHTFPRCNQICDAFPLRVACIEPSWYASRAQIDLSHALEHASTTELYYKRRRKYKKNSKKVLENVKQLQKNMEIFIKLFHPLRLSLESFQKGFKLKCFS